MPEAKQMTRVTLYTSSSDFCQVFQEDMNGLYLLSLLLTADREKAEQCFVSGLEDSLEGGPVFKEWAHSWARRAIIQNAVRAIDPQPKTTGAPNSASVNRSDNSVPAAQHAGMDAVLTLEPFERFVYVMTVLERYSDHECSILLGCARRDVPAARIRAVLQLGGTMAAHYNQPAPSSSEQPVSQEHHSSMFELLFGQRLATSA
ncbi:MAG: hypothetical protein WA252_02750 [Candidatus Sulfotelmatobacter sp.]